MRVYVVRALELSPHDVSGLVRTVWDPREAGQGLPDPVSPSVPSVPQSDPYVRVSLGKRTLGQRDQYVPNSLEPVFGR